MECARSRVDCRLGPAMSSKPPPGLDPKPARVGPLVRGLLALAAVFVGAFALMRGNANAGIFIVLAVVCVGFALVSLLARGLQRFGGGVLTRTGRSERELLIGGLLLTALLTPWSTAIPPVQWPQRFGWQSPLALVVVAALAVVQVHRLHLSSHRPPRRGVGGRALGLRGHGGWDGGRGGGRRGAEPVARCVAIRR